MKYLSLFLPSTSTIPPEKGWKLWFDEFMTLWRSFGNSPSWETELFHLYTRLAFHNTGRIDWTPYVESLFTKFMVAFGLPVTYGQSGVKVKFGLSDSGSFPYISRWIVSALGGPEGKIVQKHLDKMLLAIGWLKNIIFIVAQRSGPENLKKSMQKNSKKTRDIKLIIITIFS